MSALLVTLGAGWAVARGRTDDSAPDRIARHRAQNPASVFAEPLTRISPYPDSPDVSVEFSVDPPSGLAVGTRTRLTLRVRNLGAQSYDLRPTLRFTHQVRMRLVTSVPAAPRPENVCGHTTTGHGNCYLNVLEFSVHLAPNAVTDVTATVEVVGFECPGGGDFVDAILGAVPGPARRAPHGYDWFVAFENDPNDAALAAAGGAGPAPAQVCRSQSFGAGRVPV